jgi:hypothetical protein
MKGGGEGGAAHLPPPPSIHSHPSHVLLPLPCAYLPTSPARARPSRPPRTPHASRSAYPLSSSSPFTCRTRAYSHVRCPTPTPIRPRTHARHPAQLQAGEGGDAQRTPRSCEEVGILLLRLENGRRVGGGGELEGEAGRGHSRRQWRWGSKSRSALAPRSHIRLPPSVPVSIPSAPPRAVGLPHMYDTSARGKSAGVASAAAG